MEPTVVAPQAHRYVWYSGGTFPRVGFNSAGCFWSILPEGKENTQILFFMFICSCQKWLLLPLFVFSILSYAFSHHFYMHEVRVHLLSQAGDGSSCLWRGGWTLTSAGTRWMNTLPLDVITAFIILWVYGCVSEICYLSLVHWHKKGYWEWLLVCISSGYVLLFMYKKAECVSRKSFLSCKRICKDQSFICPSKWLAFAEGLSCDAQFNNLTCICPEWAWMCLELPPLGQFLDILGITVFKELHFN